VKQLPLKCVNPKCEKLISDLLNRGESISDFDELIAAITITNGAAIVSRDNHFNRIPGLKVISY
jgi:predicted nucleic acid-binding protein